MSITARNSSLFAHGRTPALACQHDPRFSYCLYLPARFDPTSARIVVAVHGTERGNQDYRDGFSELAERCAVIVLAPLFPCGIVDVDDMDGYKYLGDGDIRFDQVLLHMVDEVRQRYALARSRLLLFGFSGGAHFAHRFLYLHPHELAAVSICAPGNPTLLDLQAPSWRGVSDLGERYGSALDPAAMATVAIQLAVGACDLGSVPLPPATAMALADSTPAPAQNRIERLHALADSLRAHGVPCRLDVVAQAGHERAPLQRHAADFFADHLGISP